MFFQSVPLLLSKFHSLPVSIARSILLTESHTPRLPRRALRLSDMRLELNRVCPCICYRVNKRMSESQAPIMCLCHFADYQALLGTRIIRADVPPETSFV